METKIENKKKFYCETCKYTAIYLSEFNKHLISNRHKRGGLPIDYKCTTCEYVGLNKWNLTMHQATTHYTVEQKKELKFYCEVCDCVCFSALYYNTHLSSSLHKSKIIIHNSTSTNPIVCNLLDLEIKSNKNNKKITNMDMQENLKKYMKSLVDEL